MQVENPRRKLSKEDALRGKLLRERTSSGKISRRREGKRDRDFFNKSKRCTKTEEVNLTNVQVNQGETDDQLDRVGQHEVGEGDATGYSLKIKT